MQIFVVKGILILSVRIYDHLLISLKFIFSIIMAFRGGTAVKRLMTEFKELSKNAPEGILAGPINDEVAFCLMNRISLNGKLSLQVSLT